MYMAKYGFVFWHLSIFLTLAMSSYFICWNILLYIHIISVILFVLLFLFLINFRNIHGMKNFLTNKHLIYYLSICAVKLVSLCVYWPTWFRERLLYTMNITTCILIRCKVFIKFYAWQTYTEWKHVWWSVPCIKLIINVNCNSTWTITRESFKS